MEKYTCVSIHNANTKWQLQIFYIWHSNLFFFFFTPMITELFLLWQGYLFLQMPMKFSHIHKYFNFDVILVSLTYDLLCIPCLAEIFPFGNPYVVLSQATNILYLAIIFVLLHHWSFKFLCLPDILYFFLIYIAHIVLMSMTFEVTVTSVLSHLWPLKYFFPLTFKISFLKIVYPYVFTNMCVIFLKLSLFPVFLFSALVLCTTFM